MAARKRRSFSGLRPASERRGKLAARLTSRKFERNSECPIQLRELFRRQTPDVVGQNRFRETHKFITMYGAVVLETFVNASHNLRGETVIRGIHRRADHGGKARVNCRLA